MKKRSGRWHALKTFSAILFVIGILLPVGAALGAETSMPLLMKISRLETVLDLIDTMGSSDSGQAPTAQIRGMLQGVDWIDAERAIVLALDQVGDRTLSALLIPYRRVNPNFREAYNALGRDGYYIVSLPPGSGVTIPESMETKMAVASRRPSVAAISITIALRRFLENNRERIDGMMRSAGQMESAQQEGAPAISPEELRQMVKGVLETADQIDRVDVKLDLNEQQFKTVVETVPVGGSDLSSVLASGGTTTRLNAYRPVHDITFRSCSYRVDSLLDMLDTVLGPVYSKLGIDFSELISIGRNFTGETVGGMSYGDGANVIFESIVVLKDEVDSENFLDGVYLPWIEAYGKSIGRMMEKSTGTRIVSVMTRTADSRVEGQRVVGMRINVPLAPMSFDSSRRDSLMTYSMRTTVTGHLMLVASDDDRLGAMIRMVDSLKKTTFSGPLMRFEVDMGRYLASLARLIPGHGIDPRSIPDFGSLTCSLSTGGGRIISSAAMDTDDIRLMIAYLREIKGKTDARTNQPPPLAAKPTKTPEPVIIKDAAYWIDRGELAATYGAYESAVRCYEKALAAGAEEGRTHFNLGIAYGELGNYPMALDQMEKAIGIDPGNAAYYYGRGRVYLLSGDKGAAIRDFEHASALGNADARRYLDGMR
ncbi:MAG: tetratricopeptide repeat protein [Deltaproteobacteria bacterium]|nr:tetratricopeptide repeat protein [Deltaproteobacteria bacterium]